MSSLFPPIPPMDPNDPYGLLKFQQPQQPGMPPQGPGPTVQGPGAPQPTPQAPQQQAAPGQQQIDPATVEAILGLNQMKAAQSGVDRQRKLSDQLRADAGNQLKGQYAGRVYVAPNLLNVAGNIASNYKAGKLSDDADVREKNLGVETSAAMQRYFDALTGQKRPGTSPATSLRNAPGDYKALDGYEDR